MPALPGPPSRLAARTRPLLLATALAIVVVVTLPGRASAAGPLQPDLQTLRLPAIKICQERLNAQKRQACTGLGHTVLRVTNRVANAGAGPLEFSAVSAMFDVPADCHGDGNPDTDGDGDPDDNDVWVEQRTYQDANGNGTFQRGTDGSFTAPVVGCRYFHPEHNHYHFEDFARFVLQSEQTGAVVRNGNKISFCVADSASFNLSLPGAPSSEFYPGGCQNRLGVNGTSVGWYDQYGWGLPGQEIDVTGVPAGTYCLVAEADPENLLDEIDEANNTYATRIQIDPATAPIDSGTGKNVKRLSGPCAFPPAS